MPIPLIKSEKGWRFDTHHAAGEILNRHIGRNELAAIQVCLAIVDAEREYAMQDADGDGVPGFASKFVSSPGKRDGLYWETREDEPLSPVGPLLAARSNRRARHIRFGLVDALSWLSVSNAHQAR